MVDNIYIYIDILYIDLKMLLTMSDKKLNNKTNNDDSDDDGDDDSDDDGDDDGDDDDDDDDDDDYDDDDDAVSKMSNSIHIGCHLKILKIEVIHQILSHLP